MSSSSASAAPVTGFAHFDLRTNLQRAIDAAGYVAPRPIQEGTIPHALAGRDVLGLAQTGTGKTAAFALPVLERLLDRPQGGPRALVVAPTRELAVQIDTEFRRLAQFTNIRTVTLYGGVSEKPQIAALRRRPEVVVACPGRLLDLHGKGAIRFDLIETLILDEADHMFDMGFLPDLRRIVRALPQERQNLLFAATMPSEIRTLASEMLRDPVVVELAHSKPAETIDHALYPVHEGRKTDLLHHFLSDREFVSAIVFTRTKHRAKRLAKKLDRDGHRAVALQGNMSQGQRDRAMKGFRDGRFDVLVATDLVARGIDVAQVSHVINFDVPNTPEAYTHRIGRTGRAERSGKAYTFVTSDDHAIVRAIERTIGAAIPRLTVDGFERIELPVTPPASAGRAPRAATGPRASGAGGGASRGARKRRPRRGGGAPSSTWQSSPWQSSSGAKPKRPRRRSGRGRGGR